LCGGIDAEIGVDDAEEREHGRLYQRSGKGSDARLVTLAVRTELPDEQVALASDVGVSTRVLNTDIEDPQRAEQPSALLESQYRSIVDGLPAIVTLLNPEGHVEHANQHMLEYLGTKLEEMRDRAVGQAFHPDDRPGVLARWEHSAKTGEPYDFEARLRRADGAYRWFHTRGLPLRDANGRIFLWYFLQTDIDDRKRAEALLAGEKRLLEMVARGDPRHEVLEALCLLVESTAGGCYCSVVLADPTGARVEHGAAPSLPASFIGSIIGRAINAETGPCGMATYLNEQVVSTDLTRETRWATWCPMALAHGLKACWSTPITSSAGKALGAFAIYHESPKTLTSFLEGLIQRFTHIASIAVARVQNDAALKRSEAFLAEGQRLSATGSYHWRVATDELTWSDQVYRIFDIDLRQAVTLALVATRFHPEDARAIDEIVRRARNEGGDFESDFRLRMPDGVVKHLHVVAKQSEGDDGQREYIGALQDVTPRRLSEEALAAARAELAQVARAMSLGVMTASIAHEVNQPLAGIVTNAGACLRMLAADPPNLEGARETARRTIRDSNRASDVISRLRALFTKREIITQRVDLNQVVRDVIALASGELQRARVVLRAELADSIPMAAGDRVQLQQVVMNLLLNAADAMNAVCDRSRDLVIRTNVSGEGSVSVSVTDAGVGLDPQVTDKIFDPFYTTKPLGMGIGLSVSRAIVESHRGRLSAISNDGHGATFEFVIPSTRQHPASAPGKPE
jgi:PAS domain S-box-containing protein